MEQEWMESLKHTSSEEMSPYIPKLLDALKNEKNEERALEILLRYPTESTVFIEEALLSNDFILQKILLQQLVPRLPFYSKMVVANAVEQIALIPGELQQLAQTALQSFEP
jgi:hypothetical protein